MIWKNTIFFILLVVVVLVLTSFQVYAAEQQEKSAILIAAFGTSYHEAAVSIENVVKAAQQAFPEQTVVLSYGSRTIRNILKERDGVSIDSPMSALAKLADEGYGSVVVQPLQIMSGSEFHEILSITNAFRTMNDPHYQPIFSRIEIGDPLLTNEADYEKVVVALENDMKQYTSSAGEVLVLVGHGTEHPANSCYSQLQNMLQKHYGPKVLVGTIEGYPTIEDILSQLKAMNAQRVTLKTFMLVAGDHARNDIAGDEADSWKTVLKKAGYEVQATLDGLGENDQMVQIWIEHIKDLLPKK
ncbi:MAG: sirohydrochlorin cobaltochelatase [Atribacter sp.]|jgi:sirohydrochlorin cobaltochelatase|uniref:sirohydrochlorin cobaltochelatase n=2 Tax=Atribacter sp. TaxID=2847780 RepID=UPI003D99F1F0